MGTRGEKDILFGQYSTSSPSTGKILKYTIYIFSSTRATYLMAKLKITIKGEIETILFIKLGQTLPSSAKASLRLVT